MTNFKNLKNNTNDCTIELKREDTDGEKSVRFCVNPVKNDRDISNDIPKSPHILVSQSTNSSESSVSSILVSHKRSNTVQPRRTQQSGLLKQPILKTLLFNYF